jgi:predicted nucleic acid-binding protein
MIRIFADACYWYALLNRNDGLHTVAVSAQKSLKNADVVTTDEVLGEVLNLINTRAPHLRPVAAAMVEGIRNDARVQVVEQSRASFDGGLGRYKGFADKQWSFVDCVSFELMTRDGIMEALTDDHHFEQAGFAAKLREKQP